jgi:peptidoglycan/LPS O-acetylase OafA/YrhL
MIRRDIQGLRGLAVLLVVLYHSGLPIDGGFVGVDVFFVVSGFVISKVLLKDESIQKSAVFRSFYLRRAKRLIPAAGTLTVSVLFLSWLIESSWFEYSRTARTALSAIFLHSNLHLSNELDGYFSLGSKTNPLLHMWSLSLEEQFYFAFPLLFIAGLTFSKWNGSRNRRVFLCCAVLVSALSLVLTLLLSYGSEFIWSLEEGRKIAFYSPFSRAWEFGVGSVVALYISSKSALNEDRPRLSWVAPFGLLGTLLSALLINKDMVFPGYLALIPVLSTAALLTQGASVSWVNTRLLSNKILVAMGDRSYSWYLWHWPMIVFAQRLFPSVSYVGIFAALFSLVPAELSYRFIETPWRKLTSMSRSKAAGFVAAFLILPTIAALALKSQSVDRVKSSIDSTATSGWEVPLNGCLILEENCLRTATSGENNAVLIGDSHAASLAQAFKIATETNGFTPQIGVSPGCPFIRSDRVFYLYNFGDENKMSDTFCVDNYDLTFSWILKNTPKVIVIAQNTPFYVRSPELTSDFELRVSCERLNAGGCVNEVGPENRIANFMSELDKTFERLEKSNSRVVLVAPLPIQLRDPITSESGLIGTPRSAVEAQRQATLNGYVDLAARYENVEIFDPIDSLCSIDFCPSVLNGVSLYSDNGHLSIAGAELTSESLGQFFRP